MSDQPKLGQLIEGEAHRDAVHVAVVPIRANRVLKPGERVGVLEGGELATNDLDRVEPIGVVDPFLKAPVEVDQRFYLFLYPGSAIGLRHVYRHPVLDHEEIRRETMEKLNAPSVEYIRKCAAVIDMTYGDLVEALSKWVNYGEGTDVNMDQSNNAMNIDWPQLWAAWGELTGSAVPRNTKEEPFNCKC